MKLWYSQVMTDTPKRRGRPKGSKLSAEHRAKIAEAARRQHANPETHARWRQGMEVVWADKRAKREAVGETPIVDENTPKTGTEGVNNDE